MTTLFLLSGQSPNILLSLKTFGRKFVLFGLCYRDVQHAYDPVV